MLQGRRRPVFLTAAVAAMAVSVPALPSLAQQGPAPDEIVPLIDDYCRPCISPKFLLWSSMPDPELFELAVRGVLRDPETLRREVERMLADDKADTLGTVFAAEWLRFRHVGTRIWLDPIDNPWCTATLMTARRRRRNLRYGVAKRAQRGRSWAHPDTRGQGGSDEQS